MVDSGSRYLSVSADVAPPESASAVPTTDRDALLADALSKLVQAGFAQHAAPVEGVISMQRAWQGPGEDSVIVDSITIHIRDQALAERHGDGIPTWGPKRGPWADTVAALLALPPPNKFVIVRAEGPSTSPAALPGSSS